MVLVVRCDFVEFFFQSTDAGLAVHELEMDVLVIVNARVFGSLFLPVPGALPLAITSHAVGVKNTPLLTRGLVPYDLSATDRRTIS